jgi:hypothetical protein
VKNETKTSEMGQIGEYPGIWIENKLTEGLCDILWFDDTFEIDIDW